MKVDKLTAGFVTGLWAAVTQAWVYIAPPSAFGICFISHPSDLIDWIVNHMFGTTLYVHDPSVDIPVLTVVGVLVGASISTFRNREFSFRLPSENRTEMRRPSLAVLLPPVSWVSRRGRQVTVHCTPLLSPIRRPAARVSRAIRRAPPA